MQKLPRELINDSDTHVDSLFQTFHNEILFKPLQLRISILQYKTKNFIYFIIEN